MAQTTGDARHHFNQGGQRDCVAHQIVVERAILVVFRH